MHTNMLFLSSLVPCQHFTPNHLTLCFLSLLFFSLFSFIFSFAIRPSGYEGNVACKPAEEEDDTIPFEMILALVAGCILVTVALTKLISKLSMNDVNSDFEKKVTADEELQEACTAAIQEQWGWIIFEQLDGLSDVANGVLVLYEGTLARGFMVLFVLVAILGCLACFHGCVKRNQILKT